MNKTTMRDAFFQGLSCLINNTAKTPVSAENLMNIIRACSSEILIIEEQGEFYSIADIPFCEETLDMLHQLKLVEPYDDDDDDITPTPTGYIMTDETNPNLRIVYALKKEEKEELGFSGSILFNILKSYAYNIEELNEHIPFKKDELLNLLECLRGYNNAKKPPAFYKDECSYTPIGRADNWDKKTPQQIINTLIAFQFIEAKNITPTEAAAKWTLNINQSGEYLRLFLAGNYDLFKIDELKEKA